MLINIIRIHIKSENVRKCNMIATKTSLHAGTINALDAGTLNCYVCLVIGEV